MCSVIVSSVGQHLAVYVAEWQKANTILSYSAYAENINMSNKTVFTKGLYSPQSHMVLMWVQSLLLFVSLATQSLIAHLQNAKVRTGNMDEGFSSSLSLLPVAVLCTDWMDFGQLRLFTGLWMKKRMHSLNEEIDTTVAVARI